jgi:hypothetical protein
LVPAITWSCSRTSALRASPQLGANHALGERDKVTGTRPNFSQTMPKKEAPILPPCCADLRVLPEKNSEVTGRVVDARGEPIRNWFHLSGQGRSLSESRLSIAFLVLR